MAVILRQSHRPKDPGVILRTLGPDPSLSLRMTDRSCHPEAVSSPKDLCLILKALNQILRCAQDDSKTRSFVQDDAPRKGQSMR